MKFCNVSKFLLAMFIIGIGVGIFVCKFFCLGYICALIIVGLGIWRLF
ncbi:MAG: hypothetical protein ACLR9L_06885 [Lachnospirales bacterium]